MGINTPQEAWSAQRPIYARLPYQGYQDNPVADWVTQWPDSYLVASATKAQQFYLEVSPDTAQNASLDYLGWLVGYSGTYWDPTWDPAIKRNFIRYSHSYLWPNRGTFGAIRKVLSFYGFTYDIWQDGDLKLTFSLPGTFGTPQLRFYLRLPLAYDRAGYEWKEARRTLRNFAPAVVKASVSYQRFYLGFSRVGDPLFSS